MKFKTFLLCILFSLTTAKALVLEDLVREGKLEQTLRDQRIGFYLGSFDPLHCGHVQTTFEALNFDTCDYVLIYPAWGGDEMKNRTDVAIRLEMLFAKFKDDTRVIVTRMNPIELQQALTQKDGGRSPVKGKSYVKPSIPGARFFGLIGSDTAFELAKDAKKRDTFMAGMQVPKKYAAHTIGGVIALPAEGFIISLRNDDSIDQLEGKIGDRPIVDSYTTYAPFTSSTKVRAAIKAGKSIEDMVPEEMIAIIEKYNLYRD
ncbi:MAG: nicotinate-nicotinamide nucleotide adenylyltransferase [Holosporales bacterium]